MTRAYVPGADQSSRVNTSQLRIISGAVESRHTDGQFYVPKLPLIARRLIVNLHLSS